MRVDNRVPRRVALICAVLLTVVTASSASEVGNPNVSTTNGAFFGKLKDVFASVERIKQNMPKRGQYESYERYQEAIAPFNRRIRELYDTTFVLEVKPKVSQYDQVNEEHHFDLTFPWPAKRRNDLKPKRTLRYFIRSRRGTVTTNLAGKLYAVKAKVYFQMADNAKQIRIRRTELFYYKKKIYDWE